MKDLVLKNLRILDPKRVLFTEPLDVQCSEGVIASITSNCEKKGENVSVYNCNGLFLLPGLIDMHVGFPLNIENPQTQLALDEAKRGGFTDLLCVPNTEPILDKSFLIGHVKNMGREASINTHALGAITEGLCGEQLSEMALMKKSGAIAFADTAFSTMNAKVLRCAMDYARSIGSTLFLDCEERHLSGSGLIQESVQSTVCGLEGIPSEAEFLMVARNLALAELTGASIHIQSVSTARSVALIAEAKSRGVAVTAETAPQYFSLTSEDLLPYDKNFKVKPPLRERHDREAIRQAVLDDVIDVIVSQHLESKESQEDALFHEALFSSQNMPITLASVLTSFQEESESVKARILSKMTLRPSQIMNLTKERIVKENFPANLTVVDFYKDWSLSALRQNKSKRQSPFVNKNLKGKPVLTVVAGKCVYSALDDSDHRYDMQ